MSAVPNVDRGSSACPGTAPALHLLEDSARRPIAYLCGPMTGLPDFNYPAFNNTAEVWRKAGWHVLNPAESYGGEQSRPKSDYMRIAMQNVAAADAIVLLSEWHLSEGARLEAQVGLALNLPFHFWFDYRATPVDHSAHVQEALSVDPEDWPTWIAGGKTAFRNFADEEVVTIHDFTGAVDGGGYKGSMDDPDKLPLWLVPNALVFAAGRALAHGAHKYAPNNWRRGMEWGEVYSALQRHLTAWLECEGADQDSGLNHLDHAAACLAFLCEYEAQPQLYSKHDNRFRRPEVA